MSGSANRAQSESLGSLLLVAVVVISVGTFGAYYVASATGGGVGGADSVDLTADATQDELRLSHNGGPSVATADLRLTTENASGEYTYGFDDGTIRGGDGNTRFDAGETWRLAWNQSPETEVTISLVDTDADQPLFRGSTVIESPATDRPANLADGREAAGGGGGDGTGESDGGSGDDREGDSDSDDDDDDDDGDDDGDDDD